MKARSTFSRIALGASLAVSAWLTVGVAHAQEPMWAAQYGEAHMMPVGLSVEIGWHGDRYWDGHRYWAHDEWMHRHPHDRDPRHDDRREPPRFSGLHSHGD